MVGTNGVETNNRLYEGSQVLYRTYYHEVKRLKEVGWWWSRGDFQKSGGRKDRVCLRETRKAVEVMWIKYDITCAYLCREAKCNMFYSVSTMAVAG